MAAGVGEVIARLTAIFMVTAATMLSAFSVVDYAQHRPSALLLLPIFFFAAAYYVWEQGE